METIIGIDLGTTNSLCAVFKDGKPILIPNNQGEFLTPSAVGLVDEKVIVGKSAKDLKVTQPENASVCFKRYMGTDTEQEIAGKKFNSPELSAIVLKTLKEDAEKFLGHEVKDAVITVPAYFNDHQRKATKLAGSIAGLNVKRIINEPTAAALVYGFHDQDADKKLMIIDLGGGTFDVTIMEIFEGSLEITSTAGESFLGGEDFTFRMAAWVLQQVGKNLEMVEFRQPELMVRLIKLCEEAKRKLVTETEVSISIPDEKGNLTDQKVSMTYDQFKEITSELMQRLEKPVIRALRDSESLPDEIDEIILVGGATRMSLVSDYIKKLFKKDPCCQHDPDQVVALGAAVQAALIKDDVAVEDMVMTDVCPFTLGMQIVKTFGRQNHEGYFLPVIHRNTVIPVSREETVFTMHDNQQKLTVEVYQGESRKVKDNIKLGELAIEDLPPAPEGQPINVRFSYDMNGILEVELHIPKNGKKYRTVLTNHVKNLSEEEIQSAVKKLQGLKFYPRDQQANRDIVVFAESIVGEVNAFERESLEQTIDAFEHAMSSGEQEIFEAAKQELLMRLSSLGHPYKKNTEGLNE
ncbi:MAG: Hsp70 family protein [Lentisphaeraceae bacterium]|nr:Hsp70 family protein [Lentisphaeraceae bacterium]